MMLSDIKDYLTHCTDAELNEIKTTAAQIKEAREKEQFAQLVRNFIQAREKLREAFPTASCYVESWDDDDEINILSHDLSPSMFER